MNRVPGDASRVLSIRNEKSGTGTKRSVRPEVSKGELHNVAAARSSCFDTSARTVRATTNGRSLNLFAALKSVTRTDLTVRPRIKSGAGSEVSKGEPLNGAAVRSSCFDTSARTVEVSRTAEV